MAYPHFLIIDTSAPTLIISLFPVLFFLLHFKTFFSCIGNLLADLGLVVGKACCKRYLRKTFDCWFGRKCLAALMALLELSALGFNFCARTFFRSVEVGVCCFKAEHQNRVVLCECLSQSSLCISVLYVWTTSVCFGYYIESFLLCTYYSHLHWRESLLAFCTLRKVKEIPRPEEKKCNFIFSEF